LEGVPVEVEVDISQGLPSFLIVGLLDTAVQESKERVRAAVKNSGCTFPPLRMAGVGAKLRRRYIPFRAAHRPVKTISRSWSKVCGMGWVLVGFPIGTCLIQQLFPIRNRLSGNSDFYAKPILLLSVPID
jgi:hypothetical protein